MKYDRKCPEIVETFSLIYVPAIIVTGGACCDNADKSVEVLHSDGTPWCSLPDLPEMYYEHSQTGLLTCGGMSTGTSCIKFSGGKWKPSHKLKKEHYYHSSWASPLGTVLMGGMDNDKTTELLDDTTGGSIIHFPLKYKIE